MACSTRRAFCLVASALAAKANTFEMMLLDIASGSIRTPPWAGGAAILPGSLVKPFTAIAYGKPFPKVVCRGCRVGSAPHGELDLVAAIAVSCNRYFEELSLTVTHERACLVAASYGIPAPPDNVDARIGLGRDWRMAPRQILEAYARLAANR